MADESSGLEQGSRQPERPDVLSTDRRRFLRRSALVTAGGLGAYIAPRVASAEGGEELSPVCAVTISGPRCLCNGQTLAYSATGAPEGGSYAWTISAGGTRAAIQGAANMSGVMVKGTALSTAVDDVTLKVTYTVNGVTCMKTVKLTVIEAALVFRDNGMWDADNDVVQTATSGHPTLGAVSPGNPGGTTGFFKNIEIRGTISPCLADLPCTYDFKRERQGRVGLLSGGVFTADGLDCPANQWCNDDSHNGDEDLALENPPNNCEIFVIDSPGWTPGACGAAQNGDVLINCLIFREWLEVDGHRCTANLNWHASTRIKCDGNNWAVDAGGAGNAVGAGHGIDCSAGIPEGQEAQGPFAPGLAVERLYSQSTAERLQGQNAVLAAFRSGELSERDRSNLISALIPMAYEGGPYGPWSTPMLALRLLGVLGAEEGIPAAMDRLLDDFPRPIVSTRDRRLSVAADALVRMGAPAVKLILDRADSANEEAWEMLRRALVFMGPGAQVRPAVQRRLGGAATGRARERLRGVLRTAPPGGARVSLRSSSSAEAASGATCG